MDDRCRYKDGVKLLEHLQAFLCRGPNKEPKIETLVLKPINGWYMAL